MSLMQTAAAAADEAGTSVQHTTVNLYQSLVLTTRHALGIKWIGKFFAICSEVHQSIDL